MSVSSSTSVALFDDHPLMIEAVSALLARANRNFHLVATGATSDAFVDIVSKLRPNVAVVDLNMPGDVFAAIASIVRIAPTTKIVAFTASSSVEFAIRALDAGAQGYVLKGGSPDELLQAIDTVQRNETFLTQSFAGQVITALRDASIRRIAAQAVKLSVREDQIIRHLFRGRTNKEIATELKISEKTVKHYMTVLMQKLNARNRLEVVIAAQKINERDTLSPAQDASRPTVGSSASF